MIWWHGACPTKCCHLPKASAKSSGLRWASVSVTSSSFVFFSFVLAINFAYVTTLVYILARCSSRQNFCRTRQDNGGSGGKPAICDNEPLHGQILQTLPYPGSSAGLIPNHLAGAVLTHMLMAGKPARGVQCHISMARITAPPAPALGTHPSDGTHLSVLEDEQTELLLLQSVEAALI